MAQETPPEVKSSQPAWLLPAVLAVGFACAIAGGAVIYRLAGDRLRALRTWTGHLTPAQTVTDLDACRERLRTHGQKLESYKNVNGKWPDDGLDSLPKCPRSGLVYRYLISPSTQQVWMFCRGDYHGAANAPAYDFENHRVSDQPIEPTPKTWHHYQWLTEAGDDASMTRALEEVGRFETDRDQAAQYKAAALLDLERYSDALQELESTSTRGRDKNLAGFTVQALMHLGRNEEALEVAREFSTGDEDMLYYLSGDLQRALVEAHSEGGDASLVELFVPLAQGDLVAVFPKAVKFLEERGFSEYASPYMTLAVVVSARASRDEAKIQKARALLVRALGEVRRKWPFPLLQMFNGELTPEQIEAGSKGNDSELTEYHCWQALLLEAKGQAGEARPHHQWVADHGNKGYFEYRIGLNRVK